MEADSEALTEPSEKSLARAVGAGRSLPLWLPMIPLHFPFILSGDLQTKSWGLVVGSVYMCL